MDQDKQLFAAIRGFFSEYFDLQQNKDDENVIADSIRSGVEFKGATLWILIFAIFIASLGLNVNSTAVIIGAMLISPLMGPIVGMGLAVGIGDFALMKRSLKNYGVATLFSVITATIYFTFTPLDQVQSELLARTSPNIYDVFIALFGGLAGIVALCTKNKGNVIPGVAIATALMPPLCTAGFGLATGNWLFFIGAFYLYFINSVFISVATFLGVRMFHFSRKKFDDKQREIKVRRYLVILIVITMCPACYMTYDIVRTTFYTTSANNYINEELNFPNTQVIDKKIDYKKKSISVVLIGAEVPQNQIAQARDQLQKFKLSGTELSIIQGMNSDSLDVGSLRTMVLQDFYANSERKIEEQQGKIKALETELSTYTRYTSLDESIIPELQVLFPDAKSIAMAYTIQVNVDSARTDTMCLALMNFSRAPRLAEQEKITEWLKARTGSRQLKLVVEAEQ